mgnify:CR=1 FL=1
MKYTHCRGCGNEFPEPQIPSGLGYCFLCVSRAFDLAEERITIEELRGW